MEIDDRAFVAVFVVILVVGALSAFLVISAIGDDDPYDVVCCYSVDAVIDGVTYTGTGMSEYTPESDAYRTYRFELTMSSQSGLTEELSFGVIFLADDTPDPSIFSFEGIESVGTGTVVWSAFLRGFQLHLSHRDMCTVEKVIIARKADRHRIIDG